MNARPEIVARHLPFVDRFLTLWILAAMAAGLATGFFAPEWSRWLAGLSVGTTSVPIAVGLILMMYPPLAKVRYGRMGATFRKKNLLILSLLQNWIVGPVLMTALALLFLRAEPGYMVGIIVIGLARCIAMVIVWNDLAGGNRELGIGLVALNAIFQVLFYALYIFLFVSVFLGALGFGGESGLRVSFWDSASTVLLYLGTPFLLGLLSQSLLVRFKGRSWYESRFLPRISPLTLIFLLFTILVMFSLRGKYIVEHPFDVVRIALPLLVYFLVMWFSTFFVARRIGAGYEDATALSFSAASNDFELAIAIGIALWRIGSPQAFAAIVGPLIEVPVMVLLVRFARGFRKRMPATEAV
jgi:ACR3 family arsenite transporter